MGDSPAIPQGASVVPAQPAEAPEEAAQPAEGVAVPEEAAQPAEAPEEAAQPAEGVTVPEEAAPPPRERAFRRPVPRDTGGKIIRRGVPLEEPTEPQSAAEEHRPAAEEPSEPTRGKKPRKSKSK